MIHFKDVTEGMIIRHQGDRAMSYVSELLRDAQGTESQARSYISFPVVPLKDGKNPPDQNTAVFSSDEISHKNTNETYANRYYINKDPMFFRDRSFEKNEIVTPLGELAKNAKKAMTAFLESKEYQNIQLSSLPQILNKEQIRKRGRPGLKRVTDMYLATAKDMGFIPPEAYEALKDKVATVRQALELLKNSNHGINAPIYEFNKQYPNIDETDTSETSLYEDKANADVVIDLADKISLQKAKQKKLFSSQHGQTIVDTFEQEIEGERLAEYNHLGYALGLRILDPKFLRFQFKLDDETYKNITRNLEEAYDIVAHNNANTILLNQFKNAVEHLDIYDDKTNKIKKPYGKTIKCPDLTQNVPSELQGKMNDEIARIEANRPDPVM